MNLSRAVGHHGLITLIIASSLLITSCEEVTTDYSDDISFSDIDDLSDWTEETHEKLDTDALIDNLDVVFNTTSVQKMRIVIDSDNWDVMNDDLDALDDERGNSNDFSDLDNPIFVPSQVFYYSEASSAWIEWYKVGVRFKGNSSLYNANSNKLPFKLDFDEFEDEYPRD